MPRFITLLALLAVAGCDAAVDGPRDLPLVDASAVVEAPSLEALVAAQAEWQASGVDDYEFRYERYCFCAGTVLQARVVDGAVVELWVDGKTPHSESRETGQTVDELFATAVDAFENDRVASARVLAGAAPFFEGLSYETDPRIADGPGGFRILAFERLDAQ